MSLCINKLRDTRAAPCELYNSMKRPVTAKTSLTNQEILYSSVKMQPALERYRPVWDKVTQLALFFVSSTHLS